MSGAPQFTPEFGRKSRRFERLWQCVQYGTGYDAHVMGVAQAPAFTNQWYEMGRLDAVADAQAKTFDQRLMETCQ